MRLAVGANFTAVGAAAAEAVERAAAAAAAEATVASGAAVVAAVEGAQDFSGRDETCGGAPWTGGEVKRVRETDCGRMLSLW